jgi:hypothetical protein
MNANACTGSRISHCTCIYSLAFATPGPQTSSDQVSGWLFGVFTALQGRIRPGVMQYMELNWIKIAH